jgi:hypothetical protein
MLVSILLRLRPEALAAGEVVGRAEIVETGVKAVVHDVEELLAFLKGAAGAAGAERSGVEWGGRGQRGPAPGPAAAAGPRRDLQGAPSTRL